VPPGLANGLCVAKLSCSFSSCVSAPPPGHPLSGAEAAGLELGITPLRGYGLAPAGRLPAGRTAALSCTTRSARASARSARVGIRIDCAYVQISRSARLQVRQRRRRQFCRPRTAESRVEICWRERLASSSRFPATGPDRSPGAVPDHPRYRGHSSTPVRVRPSVHPCIGDCSDTWHELIPQLAQDTPSSRRPARPRSIGQATRRLFGGRLRQCMRDLLSVLGVDRATVIGHSFGGGVQCSSPISTRAL